MKVRGYESVGTSLTLNRITQITWILCRNCIMNHHVNGCHDTWPSLASLNHLNLILSIPLLAHQVLVLDFCSFLRFFPLMNISTHSYLSICLAASFISGSDLIFKLLPFIFQMPNGHIYLNILLLSPNQHVYD